MKKEGAIPGSASTFVRPALSCLARPEHSSRALHGTEGPAPDWRRWLFSHMLETSGRART